MAPAYPQVIVSQRTLLQLQIAYVQALQNVWTNAIALQNSMMSGALQGPGPRTSPATVLNLPSGAGAQEESTAETPCLVALRGKWSQAGCTRCLPNDQLSLYRVDASSGVFKGRFNLGTKCSDRSARQFKARHLDRCQRRRCDLRDVYVVEANDRDVVRDPKTLAIKRVQHTNRSHIIRTDHRSGRFLRLQQSVHGSNSALEGMIAFDDRFGHAGETALLNGTAERLNARMG